MDDSDPISKLSLTALKTIVPHCELQSSDFKYLHVLCTTYLRKHKKKKMTQQHAIESIQHILGMYPSRGFSIFFTGGQENQERTSSKMYSTLV
jgi:hypothetical protein